MSAFASRLEAFLFFKLRYIYRENIGQIKMIFSFLQEFKLAFSHFASYGFAILKYIHVANKEM